MVSNRASGERTASCIEVFGPTDHTSHIANFRQANGAAETEMVFSDGWPYRQEAATSPLWGFRHMNAVQHFIEEEDGQDVVEYGLLIATIAIVVLVGISFFGTQIKAWFETLAGRITTT
jgi:pilus assembly protein Flp/PilA